MELDRGLIELQEDFDLMNVSQRYNPQSIISSKLLSPLRVMKRYLGAVSPMTFLAI
jgi:hypothetical protein